MTPFIGYPGQVWSAISASLSFYLSQIDGALSPAQAISLTEATFDTLINGLNAIDASVAVSTWRAEGTNLEAIEALPLTLSGFDAAALEARTAAYTDASIALQAILPPPPFGAPSLSLTQGSPVIPDMGLLEFYQGFSYETPPSGTTSANLVSNAAAVAISFDNIAAAILAYQGSALNYLYDVATRQAEVSAAASECVASYQSPISSGLPASYIWNTTVALPAMSMDASLLGTAPFTLQAQQIGVLKNYILTTAFQLAFFILVLRRPQLSQIALGTVRNGDNLMDIAARSLGDYTEWAQIAAINGLQPPWIGSSPSAGIAGWGQNLVMPTPGASGSAAGQAPNYFTNFLGTDLYIGPINGDMPPWTGDFQTISGYSNLSISIGRRLQTTLGTLIYHSDYGSRIPPEVGMIQDNQTAAHITSFGISAILSDPRVQQVLSAASQLLPNGLIAFNAVIQPAGFGSPTGVNETIGPL